MISLRDIFSYMRQPIARQVFSEDDVSNTKLINTTVPLVFGSAFQVKPLVTEPQIQRYAVAANANDIPAVQEGGNPTTPIFEPVPLGFQLFASPSLQITCDVSGPPIEGWEEQDVLFAIGEFQTWTSGYPDSWDVTEDSPFSVISETTEGYALVENTAKIDGTTAWKTGTSWTAMVNTNSGDSYEPNPGTDSLADVLEADDGTYADALHGYSESYKMTGGGFGFGLTVDVEPVSLEARVTLETNGGNDEAEVRKLYLKLPDGTTRNLLPSGITSVPTTKTTLTFTVDNNVSDTYKLTRAILEDPDFEVVIVTRRVAGGNQTVKIHEIAMRVEYGTVVDRLRLTTQSDVMTVGNRYLLRIHTVGASGDSIKGFWGGVSSHGAAIPSSDNPFAQTSAQLEADDIHEFAITAGGPKFAIEFDRGDGNGEQIIKRLELIDKSASRERFKDLQRYLHELNDRDPDEACANVALERVQTQAGNPRLGDYVDDQTTGEQLSVHWAHSLGATAWGGLRGKWTAKQMRVPQQPDGPYLSITGSFGPGTARPDTGNDLRDRVHAARNVHPLRDSETAGVTSTWPEDQRQLVIDPWRITEKADWSDLSGFPTLTLTAIDPTTGDEAGGTAVTLTGTGFNNFDAGASDTVTFGGTAATNITVVSDTEITCDTPAGTEGTVDVVIIVGGESATLAGAFEYTASVASWTPAQIAAANLPLWLDRDDESTVTDAGLGEFNWLDKSGNNNDHVSVGQPGTTTINGRTHWLLEGAEEFVGPDLDLESAGNDEHEAYVVMRGDAVISESKYQGIIAQGEHGSGFWVARYRLNTRQLFQSFNNGTQADNSANNTFPNAGKPLFILQARKRIGTSVDLYEAAEAFSTVTSSGATAAMTTGGACRIGRLTGLSSGEYLNGAITEVVVTKGGVNRDEIEGYLHHRHGIEDQLPAGHLYKSSPP